MNKFYLLVVLVISSVFANAQDKIYLKSGDNIEAKILEVNVDNVKYKKSSNLEGPTFTIEKSDIHMVVYQNGENQIFKESVADKKKKSKSSDFGKNRFSTDILSYGYYGPGTSVAYERLLKDGKMGLEIPISYHVDGAGAIMGLANISGSSYGITVGTNLKFYTAGEGKGFFVGPTMALGVLPYHYYYDGYSSHRESLTFIPGAKLGGQFQITKLIGLHGGLNLGYALLIDADIAEFVYSLNVGINFSF